MAHGILVRTSLGQGIPEGDVSEHVGVIQQQGGLEIGHRVFPVPHLQTTTAVEDKGSTT